MAFDGKILAQARQAIADRKKENEDELERRRQRVYAGNPRIRALETELTSLMSALAVKALKEGKNAGKAAKDARDRAEEIISKQGELLLLLGYPADFIDEIFTCPDCRDTGYVMAKPCRCLKDIYKTMAAKELSSILDLQGQSFERFDLSFYSDEAETARAASPRKVMENIFHLCRDYAENFGSDSVNLLFRGATGLGKTFLSAGIAKVVSEKGFSVVYDTAISVMDAFEVQKFDRAGDNAEEINSRVRRYLNCELLILDDLGTEMSTSFTSSALYNLINARLVGGKKTIISTNLSADDMRRRYFPPIISRIEGEYICLNFSGRDVRAVKRERGLE